MPDLKIALIYFSATNVTRTYADVIQEKLLNKGCKVKLFNVTYFSSRQEALQLNNYNGFIFGFPVFGDFAPRVINEWLPTLDGNGKKCAMYFTYGARTTGYAHFHTKLLLEQAGFQVQFSAEFLGRHSFNVAGWKILPSRPNEKDFPVARGFALLAIDRFTNDSQKPFNLQKPFGYNHTIKFLEQHKKSAERGPAQPVRFEQNCSMCRKCETECPNQAFNADTGLSDPMKCIECMHCVYVCPDKVIKVDDRMKEYYPFFLQDWHLTEEMMEEKESKIITGFRETAF